MKSNKITIYVCSVLMLFSGTSIFLIEKCIPTEFNTSILQSISSGIFTGFIVSLVIAIIGYFHERNVLLSKAEYGLKNLYINMRVLSRTIGNTSSQIHNAVSLEHLPFQTISDLSKYNLGAFEKMELDLFDPIFRQGELARLYFQLDNLHGVAYNISNISTSLLQQVLEYTYSSLKLQQESLKGVQISPEKLAALDQSKNAINIRTAKFHEYVTGQTLELEKIAKAFYKHKNRHISWENIKVRLDQQVEDIMRM